MGWHWKTTLAGAYPIQLCSKWSRMIGSSASPAALRDGSTIADSFVAELESLVRRGRTKGHARSAASAAQQQLGGSGDEAGASSTVLQARRFLDKHRVVFGGSSGARGGIEGQGRSVR